MENTHSSDHEHVATSRRYANNTRNNIQYDFTTTHAIACTMEPYANRKTRDETMHKQHNNTKAVPEKHDHLQFFKIPIPNGVDLGNKQ